MPGDYNLLDAIGDAIVLVDHEWRYVHHNQQAEANSPVPLDELRGRSLWEAFPSLVGSALEVAYRKAMAEKVRVELEAPNADGSRWYGVSVAPYSGGLCIQYHDITQRLAAERELRASEERLRRLTESGVESDAALRRAHQLLATIIEDAPLAVVTIDAHLKVTSWNPAAEDIFGWSAPEVVGRPLPIVPESRHAELVSMVDDEVTSTFGAISYETERCRRDGTLIDVHVATAPLHGPHGEIAGAVAFMADLSERNAARRALKEQEEHHRTITDNLPIMIARSGIDS